MAITGRIDRYSSWVFFMDGTSVTMLEAAKKQPASDDLPGYTDAASVSDFAVSALQWAVSAGLINGRTAAANRAEAAALLMRFVERAAK